MKYLLNKNIIKGLFTFIILATAYSGVDAQWNTGQRNNNALNIANRIESNSTRFRADFRREVNKIDLSRSERNRYNNFVSKFESEIKKLRSELNKNNTGSRNNNVQKRLESAINAGREVNSIINQNYFSGTIPSQWNVIRNDLNELSRIYGTGQLEGGNGGVWQGGSVRPPNWAIGTFTGRNTAGQTVTLSVSNGGQVSLNEGGVTLNGNFLPGSSMNIQGIIYRILQQGNNIAITNMAAGVTINMSRSDGWGGVTPPENQRPEVPKWAIGTWYGNDPQTGGEWSLTINQNGTVLYAFASGSTQQGTIYGDKIAILGVQYRVSQISNGIRTTNTSDGSRLDFHRRR